MGEYFELKNPDEIKKKIKYSGFSLSTFADKIGLSTAGLTNVIDKKKRTRPSTALKIANGLNLKISDIFFDVNASKSTQKEKVV